MAEPGARLDLHGYTEAEAHRAVKALLSKSQASGVRVALIVTGRGADESQSAFDLGLAGARRGVLHRLVPRWLREPEFHGLVSAWRPAHRRHGGSGAFYVQIRKLQP
ncbi:MAG: Smr/MutS family protein [Alphaproteobacteria bacterium]|nr:Smr/MutS family protein [Alphaproteobacteria bacterium]